MDDNTDLLAVALMQLSDPQGAYSLVDLVTQSPELLEYCRMIVSNLLHARECLRRESHPSFRLQAQLAPCTNQSCRPFMNMLIHLQNPCDNFPCEQDIPGCSCHSCSVVLAHLLRCGNEDGSCPICSGFENTNQKARLRAKSENAVAQALSRFPPLNLDGPIAPPMLEYLRTTRHAIEHARQCSNNPCVVENCVDTKTNISHTLHCLEGCSELCVLFHQILQHSLVCHNQQCIICGNEQQECDDGAMRRVSSGLDVLLKGVQIASSTSSSPGSPISRSSPRGSLNSLNNSLPPAPTAHPYLLNPLTGPNSKMHRRRSHSEPPKMAVPRHPMTSPLHNPSPQGYSEFPLDPSNPLLQQSQLPQPMFPQQQMLMQPQMMFPYVPSLIPTYLTPMPSMTSPFGTFGTGPSLFFPGTPGFHHSNPSLHREEE